MGVKSGLYSQQIIKDKYGYIHVVRGMYNEKVQILLWYAPIEDPEVIQSIGQKIGIDLEQFVKFNPISKKFFIKPSDLLNFSAEKYIELVKLIRPDLYNKDKFGFIWLLLDKKDIAKTYDLVKTSENDKFVEKIVNLLEINPRSFYSYGSEIIKDLEGFVYKSDKKSDSDFLICGDLDSKKAMFKIRKLVEDPRYQFNKYGYPHHRLFIVDKKIVDPFFIPDSKFPIIISRILNVKKERIEDVIKDDSRSCFYPSIYLLASGRKLVSYNVGHKMLFRKGMSLSFDGFVTEVRLGSSEKEKIILFPDNIHWVDLTKQNLFSRKPITK